jgi:hypothetical protein
LKEHITSIFRVKKAEQDTSMKSGGKPAFMLVSCLVYSTPEKSVDIKRAAWHYIPKDSVLHNILTLCSLNKDPNFLPTDG